VAFCCGAVTAPPGLPDCSCFSDWAYDGTDQQGAPRGFVPSTYRSGVDTPLIPAGFTEEAEDSFRRVKTRAKRGAGNPPPILGDGLGSATAWADETTAVDLFNGSRIADSGTHALLPPNAAAEFVTEPEQPHSLVEVEIALDANANDNLNFDLRARQILVGSVYAYFVKIARGLQGAGSGRPDLILGVTPVPDPLPSGWVLHQGVGPYPGWAEMARLTVPESAAPAQPKCHGNPPIAPNGVGKIWIRLEIVDDIEPDRPHVYAVLAWHDTAAAECGSSGDISACPRSCSIDEPDTSVNADVLFGQRGRWGFDAHEKNYRLLVWRAGSQP
jgi:hypothetical protein